MTGPTRARMSLRRGGRAISGRTSATTITNAMMFTAVSNPRRLVQARYHKGDGIAAAPDASRMIPYIPPMYLVPK